MFDVIAFDADDTLWHNENVYRDVQSRIIGLLAQYHSADWIEQRMFETEVRNIEHYGYGFKGFTLSMIETAIELTEGRISGAEIGRMIELELFIDGEFIYHLRSDGLIVATSTGSTAYSLSANGPILHPQVSAIALVPLCPHALSNRPILVGDRNEIEIRIVYATDSRAHFDGQVTVDLRNGDAVRIRRSEYSICLLHPPGYSYFAMLRQKLHWSERPKGT